MTNETEQNEHAPILGVSTGAGPAIPEKGTLAYRLLNLEGRRDGGEGWGSAFMDRDPSHPVDMPTPAEITTLRAERDAALAQLARVRNLCDDEDRIIEQVNSEKDPLAAGTRRFDRS